MTTAATEPIGTEKVNPYQEDADPIVQQTPIHIMSRRFPVVQDLDLAGTPSILGTYEFSPLSWLLSKPTISEQAARFGGLRADIRIQVLMRAAATTYGMAMVSWAYGSPANLPTVGTNFTSASQWSTANSYLLDVASSEGVEFVIPYRHSQEYYNLSTASAADYMQVVIYNLGTTSADAGDPVPSFTVYANFENIKTAITRVGSTVQEQADNRVMTRINHPNPIIRATQIGAGALTATYTAMDLFTRTLRNINTSMDTVGRVTDTLSEKYNEAKETASETLSRIPSFPSFGGNPTTQPLTMTVNIPEKERGGHEPVKQSLYGDLATSVYNPSANTLDISQPTVLSQFRGEESPSLSTLVAKPSLVGLGIISSGAPSTTFEYPVAMSPLPDVSPHSNAITWGSYYSNFFRFVRYDTLMVFHFKLTPLTSMRVRITVNYATTGSVDYDILSSVHLIKGSVDVPIYIPYLNINPVVTPTLPIAHVSVEVISPPIRIGAGDLLCYYWVTQSYRNTKFYSPQRVTTNLPPVEALEIVQEQSLMQTVHDEFAVKQTPAPPVADYMTPVTSIDTILRRFDNDSHFILDTIIPPPVTNNDWLDEPNYALAALPFAFYTGSKEVKFSTTERPVTEVIGFELDKQVDQGRYAANGLVITNPNLWNVLETVIPYVSNVPYQYMYDTSYFVSTVYGAKPYFFNPTTNNSQLFSRAGPDFGVSFPNILPNPSLWTWAT